MKFLMREFVELENFNIIPQGGINERPIFYSEMIKCVKELKGAACNYKGTQNSELRALNYKILFDALPCNQRFNNREKIKCFLCERCTETRDHLFVDCSVSRSLFDSLRRLLNNRLLDMNLSTFMFGITITKHDSKIISLFKFVLWRLRNKCRKSPIANKKVLFDSLFLFFRFHFDIF